MLVATELLTLVYEFAHIHSELDSQEIAWGKCDEMTEKFIEYARGRGYRGRLGEYTFQADLPPEKQHYLDAPNPAPHIYDISAGKNESGWRLCDWHCIIIARDENLFIDFTARQYRRDYAFPLVLPFGGNVICGESQHYRILREMAEEGASFEPIEVWKRHMEAGSL